ncbi:ATP-binding protein [Clostridium sp. FP2]|uniref:ATP-binding protein n=1 Tax=Clostridium sp. FP2 TaxID=2724481 RepID=UPI0013E9932C|nr:ATP-binding protein [Clostridium sp. FP2]MBZ9621463.1 ATP-binding protein [Clostridium sp. FP2]
MNKIFLPNGIEAVEAEYTTSPIEEYNNNPFIQSLPPLINKESIVRKLILNQPFNIEDRKLDGSIRVHMIKRIYKVFQPLPIHVKIWNMIDSIIRQGYISRNPFDKEYKQIINENGSKINRGAFNLNNSTSFTTTASCGLLAGYSGMGKTTTVNRCLRYIPQIICHNYYNNTHFNQTQLTWLRLEAPTSLKSLALQFFMKIDSILGTDNLKRYISKNLSTDALLSLMGTVSCNIGLGLIIIDEFQNLNRNGVSQIMNFLVSLINSCGVSLLFIGTPACYDIFSNELRIARRITGNGEVIWNNMNNDQEFKLLLKAIWRYQWVRKPVELTEEMIELFYDCTQGVLDLVVKLFVNSMKRAIETGAEQITKEIVIKVCEEEFKFTQPMIQAIKSGNVYKMQQYEDIRRIENVSGIVDNAKKNLKVNKQVNTIANIIEKENNIIKKRTKIQDLDEEDLRRVIRKGFSEGKSEYETLRESGYIDNMDFFKVGEEF